MIQSLKSIIKESVIEALDLKTARKMIRKSPKKKGVRAYKSLLSDVFGNKHRLYFPMEFKLNIGSSPVFKQIKKVLPDITEPEYISGRVKVDKQEIKIAKVLTKRITDKKELEDILNSFRDDPLRSGKSKNSLIVISRHPYDIAGMSTDRNWTSCMDLGGEGINYKVKSSDDDAFESGMYSHLVPEAVKHGALIAYLISDDDKNITKPFARTLIHPYQSSDKKEIYYKASTNVYGQSKSNSKFVKEVQKVLDANINKNLKAIYFKRNNDLYNDDDDEETIFIARSKKTFLDYILSVKNSTDKSRNPLIYKVISKLIDYKYWDILKIIFEDPELLKGNSYFAFYPRLYKSLPDNLIKSFFELAVKNVDNFQAHLRNAYKIATYYPHLLDFFPSENYSDLFIYALTDRNTEFINRLKPKFNKNDLSNVALDNVIETATGEYDENLLKLWLDCGGNLDTIYFDDFPEQYERHSKFIKLYIQNVSKLDIDTFDFIAGYPSEIVKLAMNKYKVDDLRDKLEKTFYDVMNIGHKEYYDDMLDAIKHLNKNVITHNMIKHWKLALDEMKDDYGSRHWHYLTAKQFFTKIVRIAKDKDDKLKRSKK
jgi:hypothetical protein